MASGEISIPIHHQDNAQIHKSVHEVIVSIIANRTMRVDANEKIQTYTYTHNGR